MKSAVPKPLTADDLAKVYTEDEVVGFKQFEEEGGQFGKAVVRSYQSETTVQDISRQIRRFTQPLLDQSIYTTRLVRYQRI